MSSHGLNPFHQYQFYHEECKKSSVSWEKLQSCMGPACEHVVTAYCFIPIEIEEWVPRQQSWLNWGRSRQMNLKWKCFEFELSNSKKKAIIVMRILQSLFKIFTWRMWCAVGWFKISSCIKCTEHYGNLWKNNSPWKFSKQKWRKTKRKDISSQWKAF